MIYAVEVVFKDRGFWSKSYVYKSDTYFEKDSIVIIPMHDFYSIGKVIKVHENYKFKEGINYKNILKEIRL